MNTIVLNRRERLIVSIGLDKYAEDLKKDIEENPNKTTIEGNSKRLEQIGEIKERLRRF